MYTERVPGNGHVIRLGWATPLDGYSVNSGYRGHSGYDVTGDRAAAQRRPSERHAARGSEPVPFLRFEGPLRRGLVRCRPLLQLDAKRGQRRACSQDERVARGGPAPIGRWRAVSAGLQVDVTGRCNWPM